MYSIGACAILEMTNQDALSEDLKSYPCLNSAFQRFTCEHYYRCGLILAPLSIGLTTSRHYLSEMEKRVETTGLTREQAKTLSKYEGLGAAMVAKLMIGFWFGIGAILAVKTMNISLSNHKRPKES